MKKTLQIILTFTLASMLLAACGEKNNDTDVDISQLVGTWQINSIDGQNCDEDGGIDIVCDDTFCLTLAFVFNDDYTWQQTLTFTVLGQTESEMEQGTFSVDGNGGITLCLDDSSQECMIAEYSIVSQSLVMTFEVPEDGVNCKVTFRGDRQ